MADRLMHDQRGGLIRRLGGAEIAAVLIFVAVFAIPLSTKSVLVYSVLNQVLVGVVATFSVWIMLRMNLLSFATPAFMAIGGYTVAIAGRYDITDAFLLTAGAFVLPALVAVPLGALVLRLRGTYFVLVTFVLSQIMQLLLFAYPDGLVVGDIQSELDIPNSTLSHHLEKLKNEELVNVRRESTFLRYTANTEALQELLQFLYAECCTRNKAVKPQNIVQLCK